MFVILQTIVVSLFIEQSGHTLCKCLKCQMDLLQGFSHFLTQITAVKELCNWFFF